MANFKISVILYFMIILTCCYCKPPECAELTEFECKDGSCIKTENVCDRKKDCPDGEDEESCEFRLCEKPNWFLCGDNKTCISSAFVCDDLENCPGGDDEDNCGTPHKHATCNKFEFTCTDKTCIPLDMVCDGKHDCPDKSDETVGCTDIESQCKGFLCKNRRCLESHQWVCDGYDDCGDGSDEVGCIHNCKLEERKFLCKDNDSCISIDQVCDNKEDCIDKSDEHEMCKNRTTKCNSEICPSPSECIMLPSGPVCVCPKGFYFNATRKRCLDVNECETFGICTQGCNNTEGSYVCTCDDKFVLQKDGRTCQVKGGEPLLLYTTQKTVVGIYLKSRHMYRVATNLSQVIGVTYDGINIYWTDIKHNEESIVRAREDGSKQEIILTSGLEAPEDLAIDWLTGNIYFTDNMMKHIAVCSNNGYVCTTLVVEDVDQPRGIALYPTKGIMYWTDWGKKPMIATASMDGRNAKALVDTEIHWPNGVTLDIPNNRLYWVDAKLGRIETIMLDGNDRRVILNDILKHPYGIAVFEDTLYWSDWGTKSIHSCHKFTGKHHEIVAKDRTIYDVHIYHSALQPKTDHPCISHKCSHLCLLAVNNSYSCACPEGMMLGVDQLTCKKVVKKQRLYMGIGNYLIEMEHTAFGRHKTADSIILPLYIHKMAFNSINGTIFIADNVQRIIFELNLATRSPKPLISSNIGNVSAMSFDHLANNLYWSDSDRHTIEVYSMKKRQRAIVHHFSGADIPISMVAIPEAGKMFIALRSGTYTHIDIQKLNGRGYHHHVVEDKLGSAGIQLFVDHDSETVFWLDTASGKIEFTNYEGAFRHLFRSRLRAPSSMTVIDEDVMWSSYQSPSIYWTHKSNLGSIKKFELDKPPYMNFPDDIPLLSSKPLYVVDHRCQHNNGDCSHICVSMGKLSSACLCPPGLVFKDNKNMTCIDALDCEFRCHSGECLTSSRRCNGHKDCVDGSDEVGCGTKNSEVRKTCTYDQFACHDGTQCVSNEARCDKVVDCKDKSDEDDCERFDHEKKCRQHQHACDNGRCVDITTLCDGFNDCVDGSDEKFCGNSEEPKILCGRNMFTCTSGQCIPQEWECDAHMDCVDGSDEHEKCPPMDCPKGSTRCKMGQCIDMQLVCDGHNDCGDNSDEMDCSARTHKIICGDENNNKTDPTKFQCPSDPTKCLDIQVKCNGTAECPRGEDEVGCSGCSFYEFQCRDDKTCIRKEFRCDKQKDCSDGSDELNCQYYNGSFYHQFATMCQDDMFDCGDGTCIEQLRICDDTPDCKNGQDESPICKSACSNSPCEHKCTASPYGAICSCRNGYRLNADKKTCKDIDECLESNPCAQTCENNEGGYRCGCYGGFLLRSDKTSCKSIESDHYLLFSSFDQIRKLSENPFSLNILWSLNDSRINGMDVIVRNKKMYYTVQDTEAIYEYNLNTTNRKELLNEGKKEKVAVDWVTNNVYVIDYSGFYSIKVCNFEKYACARVIRFKTGDMVKALTVDAVNKYLFYAIVHSSTFGNLQTSIYRAGLDGSHKELIVSKAIFVTALECDTYKKKLYFIDTHSKTLQMVNYQGGNPKILIRHENTITNPSGLTIFENIAFIINTGSPEAVKCPLYGDGTCKAFNLNVFNAEDIIVVAPSRQRKIDNVCENDRCSLICVQAELGSKCLCQDGQIVQFDVKCDNQSTNNIINKEFAAAENESSRSGLTAFLIIMALILIIISGYLYYRRRTASGNFNINMHFQNPLSLGQQTNRTDRTDNNETSQVKMCRPIRRLWQSGRVSNLSEISVYTPKKEKSPTSDGNNRNATEDSDDESGRDVENYRDDPWTRLVK